MVCLRIFKIGFYLNYVYYFKLFEKVCLGLGVCLGFVQYNVKLYEVQVVDQGDQVFIGMVYFVNVVDINVGFNFYMWNFFVMGVFNYLLIKSICFIGYNQVLVFNYNFIMGYIICFKKKLIEVIFVVFFCYVCFVFV